MKWYVKIELHILMEADDMYLAEGNCDDIIAILKQNTDLKEYWEIKETWIDATDFDEWENDWESPYL